MLATLALTVIVGLPVDKLGGIPGQLAVSVWTWALFLVLLQRINRELRLPLILCLVISTIGECCLSLVWGLYVYWLHNVPFFVPPGHVLLFTLGLTFAPRAAAMVRLRGGGFRRGVWDDGPPDVDGHLQHGTGDAVPDLRGVWP